jgi:hypothetical protein
MNSFVQLIYSNKRITLGCCCLLLQLTIAKCFQQDRSWKAQKYWVGSFIFLKQWLGFRGNSRFLASLLCSFSPSGWWTQPQTVLFLCAKSSTQLLCAEHLLGPRGTLPVHSPERSPWAISHSQGPGNCCGCVVQDFWLVFSLYFLKPRLPLQPCY